MRGITAGGECVRRIRGNHVNLRHGQAHALREPLHDIVDARQFFARDRPSAVHGQGDLVGEEVRDKVHQPGKDQGQNHAVPATEVLAQKQQEQRKGSEQQSGFKGVSHKARFPITTM